MKMGDKRLKYHVIIIIMKFWTSIVFIFVFSLLGIAQAHAIDVDLPFGGVVVVHSDCSHTIYDAENNTALSRGESLLSAMTDAADGDAFYLSVGTFDIGNNGLDLSLGDSGNVHLYGAGKYLTTISADAPNIPAGGYGAMVKLGTSAQIMDLGIVNKYPELFSFTVYWNESSNETYLKNVYVQGETDGLYGFVNGTITNTYLYNVTVVSKWDTAVFSFSQNSSMNIADSSFTSTGGTFSAQTLALLPNAAASALYITSEPGLDNNVTIYDSTFSTTNGVHKNNGIANGGSKMYIFGSTISTSGTSPSYDLTNSVDVYRPNTETGVYETTYDHAKTLGSITDVPPESIEPKSYGEPIEEGCSAPTISYRPYIGYANLGLASATTTVMQATIESDGNLASTTERGFIIGTESGVYTSTSTDATSGPYSIGTYSIVSSSFLPGQSYYVKAYAKNSQGISVSPGETEFYYEEGASSKNVITASVNAGGAISPSGYIVLDDSADQSFEIIPSSGYHLVDVLVDGVSVGATTSYQFNIVVTYHTIRAIFESDIAPSSPSPSYSGSSSGSRVSSQVLASLFSPTVSTTTATSTVKVVANCPKGFICTPKSANQSVSYSFAKNLSVGSMGSDVKLLQQFLNSRGYLVAKSGPGSTGNETSYFGELTRQAVARFQKDNKLPALGFFGPMTRAVIGK